MPQIIKAIIVLIASTFSSTAAADYTTITASDGVHYELAPTPPAGVVWLQPGEEREITSGHCSLDNTGWLQRQYTCTSARVVAALEPGLVEFGGNTSTRMEYRDEIIFGFVNILALLLGVGFVKKLGITHLQSLPIPIISISVSFALAYSLYSLFEYNLFLAGAVCASALWAYIVLVRSARKEILSPWFLPSTLTLAAALTINLAVLLMQ